MRYYLLHRHPDGFWFPRPLPLWRRRGRDCFERYLDRLFD